MSPFIVPPPFPCSYTNGAAGVPAAGDDAPAGWARRRPAERGVIAVGHHHGAVAGQQASAIARPMLRLPPVTT